MYVAGLTKELKMDELRPKIQVNPMTEDILTYNITSELSATFWKEELLCLVVRLFLAIFAVLEMLMIVLPKKMQFTRKNVRMMDPKAISAASGCVIQHG